MSPSGAIEPPDHPLGDLDGVALLVVGGDQLMDEPFGVDPGVARARRRENWPASSETITVSGSKP